MYIGPRGLRAVLVRGLVFGLAASAALALPPLVARDRRGGGPLVYGLLLGAFGVGAAPSGWSRHCHRSWRRWASHWRWLVPPGSFSTFNISVQMATAFWVQARALAGISPETLDMLGFRPR